MDRRTFLRQCGGSASVASVSAISGCTSLGILGGNQPFIVTIDYPGPWSGSVGSEDGQRSVQGSGREKFEVEGDIVSAVAQKRDASRRRMNVLISIRENAVKGKYTTASYGTVSVSHRRGGKDKVAGKVDLGQTDQSQRRTQTPFGVEELEVTEMVTYVRTDSQSGIVVDFQVRNPTSEVAEGQARARFKLLGNSRNWISGPITTDMSVEPDTTASYSLVLPREEFEDEGFEIDELSPTGRDDARTCEPGEEPQIYRCDAIDYEVAISIGRQRVTVD